MFSSTEFLFSYLKVLFRWFLSALVLQVETSQPKGHYWKIDTNWKINNNNNNGWSRPIRLTWQWRFALECSRKYKMMRVKTCQTTRNHPDNKTETSYNEKYSTFSQPPNQPSKKQVAQSGVWMFLSISRFRCQKCQSCLVCWSKFYTFSELGLRI